MRRLSILVCAGLLLWFTGCGGGEKSVPEKPPDDGGGGPLPAQVQGNWYVSLTSNSASPGEINLFIRQTGKSLSAPGLHAYSGSWCVQGGGQMTGSVNENNVSLTIQIGTELQLKLTGTISNGALTGTYTTSGACGNDDAGTFSAMLSPPLTGSSWVGTALFPGGSADFTANLTESSTGLITGSIAFTNSTCVTTLDVSGSHWGRLVAMTDSHGMVMDLWGSVDENSTTISGYQLLGGDTSICGFDTFTMTKP
jgi:hypothetical protein